LAQLSQGFSHLVKSKEDRQNHRVIFFFFFFQKKKKKKSVSSFPDPKGERWRRRKGKGGRATKAEGLLRRFLEDGLGEVGLRKGVGLILGDLKVGEIDSGKDSSGKPLTTALVRSAQLRLAPLRSRPLSLAPVRVAWERSMWKVGERPPNALATG
jgi:hypothetical protein